MTLAMAIVGEIIAPRERGRYQGYIQMVFVVASVAGPLLGGAVRRPRCRGAGSSTSTCRSAPPRWRSTASRCTCPAAARSTRGSTTSAARCSPPASRACCSLTTWGGTRVRVGLGRDPRPRRGDRRAARSASSRASGGRPSRSCRCGCSATRCSTSSRATLFLTLLAFFAVVVFMPLFLPGRHGRERDRVRPAAAPDAAGRPGEHGGLRTGDLPHRPLQGVPGHRPRADDGRPRAALADGRRHARGDRLAAAGRVRHRLRDGHAGPDDRDPERRRPQRPRHRHRDGEPVPLARRVGRRRASSGRSSPAGSARRARRRG